MTDNDAPRMRVDYESGEKVYLQIARAIRDRIISGELPVGAQIPSGNQMKAEWGVNRLTGAQAVEELRKAGLVVAYGTREPNMSKWLPEVAPAPGDIKIVNIAQDRFYNTDLDQALKTKGITTLIMVGWKVSGSVAYTSVGATLRDYTVVIPVDTTTAATDYETTIGFYQILNQGNGNLANEPLKPKAPTLSRTDMISFQ